jgi:hypothetical protein
MSNTFIQTPSSQPAQYVPVNIILGFVTSGGSPENPRPSDMIIQIVTRPRPEFGQLWPR